MKLVDFVKKICGIKLYPYQEQLLERMEKERKSDIAEIIEAHEIEESKKMHELDETCKKALESKLILDEFAEIDRRIEIAEDQVWDKIRQNIGKEVKSTENRNDPFRDYVAEFVDPNKKKKESDINEKNNT